MYMSPLICVMSALKNMQPTIVKRVRIILTSTCIMSNHIHHSYFPYNKPIDKDNLAAFLERTKSGIKLDYILSHWKPVTLIFGGTAEDEAQSDAEAEFVEEDM